MNITQILEASEQVWKELKSEKTATEIQEILETSDELRNKVQEMFDVGKEAAGNITEILALAFGVAERLGASFAEHQVTRALTKPITTKESAVFRVIGKMQEPVPTPVDTKFEVIENIQDITEEVETVNEVEPKGRRIKLF